MRNLIFVRAGDNSLHRSWVVPRKKRNFDLFISYFGSTPGKYRDDGEYYEAAPGLKYPVLTRLLREQPDLIYSYDAIWIPDDDLLISAALVNRMFELFHQYKLVLAQPALAPGSYVAHDVTRMIDGKSIHFSRYVEVMCPLFAKQTLKKLAHTFSMNNSSWGIDFLWGHLLRYPARKIAILDETPVVHTRPIGKGSFYDALKGEKVDAREENQKIIRQYKIDWDALRSRLFGTVDLQNPNRAEINYWISLYYVQERIDGSVKCPIFYENRSKKLFGANAEMAGNPLQGSSELQAARSRFLGRDILKHWNLRRKVRAGKAMIVCADARSALHLFRALSSLRPAWKRRGMIKLASSSRAGTPQAYARLREQFKDPDDPLQIIIVDSLFCRDFDCPILNTLYADVPFPVDQHVKVVRRLMEAFGDRLATLVVDYVGLSDLIFQRNEMATSAVVPAAAETVTERKRAESPRLDSTGRVRWSAEGNPLPVPRFQLALRAQKRIAHLFLVRKALNHESIWNDFFRGNEKYYNIYVHAKERDEVTCRLFKKNMIPEWCETHYGHVSLVEAELLLLKAALRERENEFFLLHSESCVPLRPFKYVYQQLFQHQRSWMYAFKGDLWRYYGTDASAVPHDCFFKCSQFFCLTRRDAQLVVNKGNLKHWKQCECPDEHYIPTLLAMNGTLSECVRIPLTFVNWNRKRRETPYGPTTFHKLTSADVKALMRTESLFGRKFAPDSNIGRHIQKLYGRPEKELTVGTVPTSGGAIRTEAPVRTRAALLAA